MTKKINNLVTGRTPDQIESPMRILSFKLVKNEELNLTKKKRS